MSNASGDDTPQEIEAVSMKKPCDCCGVEMEVEHEDVDFCDACAARFSERIAHHRTHCVWCGHALNITDTPRNDSPNWNSPAIEALRKRDYKRINDPRESRTEIKQRVIMGGGTMDEAFEEIKRVESASGDDEELKEALDAYEDTAALRWAGNIVDSLNAQVTLPEKRKALESLFGRIREERDRARTELAEAERVMREIMDNSESVLRQIANAKGEES